MASPPLTPAVVPAVPVRPRRLRPRRQGRHARPAQEGRGRRGSPHPRAAATRPRRNRASTGGPAKLFVLDTNVLMHDPMSLFRFEEHDVYVPMMTLEELDDNKKGMSEVRAQRPPGHPQARRARRAPR